MASIPLEDNYTDVVAKAQRGVGRSDGDLARQADISLDDWQRFKEGAFDSAIARKVAAALNLFAEALIELGERAWYPAPVGVEGLEMFNTAYHDMTVNSYLVFDPKALAAGAFDTGSSCAGMLDFAKIRRLKIEAIFLTHTHPDHVADLSKLIQTTGAPARVGENEQFSGATAFAAGKVFRIGNLKIETRQTSGHCRGGITYLITGLARRLAVVGDALFAGSMGGGGISYEEALRTNRREIFSLPDDTVICPGHGPMTTVGEQKRHNPFHPEFQK